MPCPGIARLFSELAHGPAPAVALAVPTPAAAAMASATEAPVRYREFFRYAESVELIRGNKRKPLRRALGERRRSHPFAARQYDD